MAASQIATCQAAAYAVAGLFTRGDDVRETVILVPLEPRLKCIAQRTLGEEFTENCWACIGCDRIGILAVEFDSKSHIGSREILAVIGV